MEDAKWCFVPTCLNSTRNTVNKWFVPIPVKPKRREQWFKAVNRNYCPNSERSILYCCSDHFNLDEDAVSFVEREGEIVVKLRKSIIPRISKQISDALKPMPSLPQPPHQQKIRLKLAQDLVKGPLNPTIGPQQPQVPSEVVSLVDGTSSDEDEQIDVIGVVTSEPTEPRKVLMGQRLSNMKQSTVKSSGKSQQLSKKPSASTSRALETKSNVVSSPSRNSSQHPSPQALRGLFESLRRSIPSICSQQGMTREQIIDEAIEFIIQMRNKSDKRQGSMHYVMENNAALTAKIQHLENLKAMHEKNEIVLNKEIINRRLGAVSAQRSFKSNKSKAKR